MTNSRPPRRRGRPKVYHHQRVDTHVALSDEVVAALNVIAPGRRSAFIEAWLRQHPQVAQHLAQQKEALERLVSGVCTVCGGEVTKQVQIGRCVYAEPCGHRMYQGKAKK